MNYDTLTTKEVGSSIQRIFVHYSIYTARQHYFGDARVGVTRRQPVTAITERTGALEAVLNDVVAEMEWMGG